MRSILALVLVASLAFSSLAMAGDLSCSSPLGMASELSSADSDFLFSSNQVAATTICDQEMQATQGQVLDIVGALLELALGLVFTVLDLVFGILGGLGV